MDKSIIGIILMFSTIFISRIISDRAMKKLDNEKKVILVSLYSNKMIYLFGVTITIVVLGLLRERFRLIDVRVNFMLFIFLIIGYALFSFFCSYRKLKKNNFPKPYIHTYLLSLVIRIAGMIILVTLVTLDLSHL